MEHNQELPESEISALDEKADLLYQFVGLYYDYAMEQKDYGTGEKTCMAEAHILKTIAAHPGVTVTEIARQFNRTKSFVSQTVKRLCEMGFVERVSSRRDARVAELYPTEKGLALDRAHRRYDAHEVAATFEELAQYCTREEIETFFRVVAAYREILVS